MGEGGKGGGGMAETPLYDKAYPTQNPPHYHTPRMGGVGRGGGRALCRLAMGKKSATLRQVM